MISEGNAASNTGAPGSVTLETPGLSRSPWVSVMISSATSPSMAPRSASLSSFMKISVCFTCSTTGSSSRPKDSLIACWSLLAEIWKAPLTRGLGVDPWSAVTSIAQPPSADGLLHDAGLVGDPGRRLEPALDQFLIQAVSPPSPVGDTVAALELD